MMLNKSISLYTDFFEYESGGSAFGHFIHRLDGQRLSTESDFLFQMHREMQKHAKFCPYCHTKINQIPLNNGFNFYDEGSCLLNLCSNCSYWVAELHENDFQSSFSKYAYSIQKTFDISSSNLPVNQLFALLKNDVSISKYLHHSTFEKIVAEILRVEYKPVEVIHVGRPKDGGIDVILILSDNERILVQCKRRKSDNKVEDVNTVKLLLGTLVEHNALKGIVVSNADYYSYYANKLIKGENVLKAGFEIELIDRGKLNLMLDKYPSTNPWDSFYEKNAH